MGGLGKKKWVIPDCELPPEGEGELKGHESVIVVNDSSRAAKIKVTVFFTDKPPREDIQWTVESRRVRCFRLNDPSATNGNPVPIGEQYALKLESDVPVVVQYGRLDNRQTNLAYYTVLGY